VTQDKAEKIVALLSRAESDLPMSGDVGTLRLRRTAMDIRAILAEPDPPSPADLAGMREIVAMLWERTGEPSCTPGPDSLIHRATAILDRYAAGSPRGVWVPLDDSLDELVGEALGVEEGQSYDVDAAESIIHAFLDAFEAQYPQESRDAD
jgi:hypothetical protein